MDILLHMERPILGLLDAQGFRVCEHGQFFILESRD